MFSSFAPAGTTTTAAGTTTTAAAAATAATAEAWSIAEVGVHILVVPPHHAQPIPSPPIGCGSVCLPFFRASLLSKLAVSSLVIWRWLRLRRPRLRCVCAPRAALFTTWLSHHLYIYIKYFYHPIAHLYLYGNQRKC